ncbi:MAG TPA: 50S ribosomal protein L11 methyltransferase [Candidatus Eremiobacteraceae bacterium]|nr:50S ribosomal protein L11 methyltransferase [Candidatus Eremiobacteraceae bacterium]
MRWRRLSLRVGASDLEQANALLAAATGVQTSVEELAPRGGFGSDAGGRPSHFRISAYVSGDRALRAERSFRSAIARARRQRLIKSARMSTASVRDDDWASGWKRYYKPMRVAAATYVVPSWRRDFKAPKDARTIMLDPGMAFGTGQHATTKMALDLLLARVRRGANVIDVGCGSGILSIAAAQRGARVYACDVDPIAVRATRDNFRANSVRAAAVKRASGVSPTFPRASIIVANITADALEPLAPAFAQALVRGGVLVTSGITRRGRRSLLDVLSSHGFRLDEERKSGEWFAFAHVKDRRA